MKENEILVKVLSFLLLGIAGFLYSIGEYNVSMEISALSLLLTIVYSAYFFGALCLVTLFIFGGGVYVSAEVISYWFFGYRENELLSMSLLFLMGCTYLVSFFCFFCKFSVLRDKERSLQLVAKNKGGPYWYVLIYISLYVFLVYNDIGLSFLNITRAESFSSRSLGLSIVRAGLVPIFISYFYFCYRFSLRPYKIVWLSLLVVAVIEILVLGDRRILISILIGVAVTNKQMFQTKTGYVFLTLSIVFMIAWGAFRNQFTLEEFSSLDRWQAVQDKINPMNQEFAYYHRVGQDIMSMNFTEVGHFSYLLSFTNLIPSTVWGGRYPGASTWYVMNFHEELYDIGGGMAFNAVAESYLNFSYLGPFFAGGILGIIMNYFVRIRMSIFYPGYAFMCSVAPFYMRYDLAGLLKSLLIFVVIFVAAKFLFVVSSKGWA